MEIKITSAYRDSTTPIPKGKRRIPSRHISSKIPPDTSSLDEYTTYLRRAKAAFAKVRRLIHGNPREKPGDEIPSQEL